MDISTALTYGPMDYLLPRGERPSYAPAPAYRKLQQSLANVKPEDFVVWAGGDPLAAIIGGMVLGQQGFSEFNFLRWERMQDEDGRRIKEGYYAPTKLVIK